MDTWSVFLWVCDTTLNDYTTNHVAECKWRLAQKISFGGVPYTNIYITLHSKIPHGSQYQ
jgi:hypothetical protein